MSLRERTRPGLGVIEPCLPSPAEAPPSGPGWRVCFKAWLFAMSEECHVYILRKGDQEEWMAKAKEGEGVAIVCVRAAGQFMNDMSNEPLHCTCCEALFSPSNLPQAFIVLIPVEQDRGNFDVQTQGVCFRCSKNNDKWILDNGPKRHSPSIH